MQGSDVSSSSSTAASRPAPGVPSPGSAVRKKRITRVVGYARGAADDEDGAPQPAARTAPPPAGKAPLPGPLTLAATAVWSCWCMRRSSGFKGPS